MKKTMKITILFIIIFIMFSKTYFVYADNTINNKKAPDGAYTDSGSEQKTNEIKERARENYLIQQHKEDDSKDEESENSGWDNFFSESKKFINEGKDGWTGLFSNERREQSGYTTENLKIDLDIMYNVLVTIGIILTVIVGGILGIKFMMASAEDKANIKEAMIPYVVGCIVIFGAFFIWKLVVSIASSL